MAIDWNLVGQGLTTAGNIYAANRASNAERGAIRDATDATTAGSNAAIAEIQRQSLQSRADLAPYNAGGQGAFAAYLRAMGVRPAPIAPAAGGTGGILAAASRTPQRAPGSSNAGRNATIGSALGGVAGGLGGAALGSTLGLALGPLGMLAGGLLGSALSGEGGDLATGSRVYANKAGNNAVFFDSKGQVISRVPLPATGMSPVPGLSRNGNPIFITSEGKIVKQQQSGGGFDDLGFDINTATTEPVEVNRVIAKGYQPSAPTDADFAGSIGIPAGETTGTGLIEGPMTAEDRYGGFLESPGYKFLFDETMRGARAQGSARGGLYSGRMLKELQERATGLASQDFGNYMARLEAASRIGANAAAQQATNGQSAGQNTANILTDTAGTLGNLALGAGQSRASSIANTSSLISSGIGALADYYGRRSADGLSKGNASGPAGGAKSGGDYIYYGNWRTPPINPN